MEFMGENGQMVSIQIWYISMVHMMAKANFILTFPIYSEFNRDEKIRFY